MKAKPELQIDFYKTGHKDQYPEKTELVYANWTPRKSRDTNIDKVVFFGLQYFIKEYLINQWNENFFKLPKEEVVERYKRRMDTSLGPDMVPTSHIAALHDKQYLPIVIKALDEGVLCPIRVPMFTISNTDKDFFWLTNYLETILSCSVWLPCTSATTALQYKKIFTKYAKETNPEAIDFVSWQGHDFSMRGMAGLEAACMSGAGHLLSFTGTDTIPAIDFLEEYYNADGFVGGSVPATEHSVMSLSGKDDEFGTFKRLITQVHPAGIVSIVSDTWNLWTVLTDYLPRLKSEVMEREGKVVVRPDSGDPVKIICGDPDGKTEQERKGVIQLLWDAFGGTTSSTGYKVLDSHVGAIYGDSITLQRGEEICRRLKENGFASTNIVFGIGSYTYQYTTRDQFGFAMKATYGVVGGEARNIFKDPVTDDGMKKSAKGLIKVINNGELSYIDECENDEGGELQIVFRDGQLVKEHSLSEIRARLYKAT